MKRIALIVAATAMAVLMAVRIPLRPAGTRPVLAAEASRAHAPLDEPDVLCAACHQAIYNRYELTPMAQGSGLAMDALQPGEFHHPASAIDYRIFARDGAAWMAFDRKTPATAQLHGERELLYFIGSGRRGRTYLYQINGQWFELPINFYARRGGWDMAPAFSDAPSMPAPLPVDPNCLHCHATEVQSSLQTARNRFANGPFRQGGIGCSACHGDPKQHLATQGRSPMLNPGNLPVAQRDSACIQCHLEGDTVVYRQGRSLSQFRPGDTLSDFAVYFVRASQQAGGGRASSQYEALLRSACKRSSGDRLTCTTCHDPHSSPSASERVQFFRARCLACHTGQAMATAHHPEQPDCALCHMPTRSTSDISHEQLTDHDIEAHPRSSTRTAFPVEDRLLPVGGVHATDAEYGMAYAQLALHGNHFFEQEALHYLRQAVSEARGEGAVSGVKQALAPDAGLDAQLGFLEQLTGHTEQARTEYISALKSDPYQPTALANLGVLDASAGQLKEAILLLDRLIQADPSQTAAGLNLAWIECTVGYPDEARGLLHRLAAFNPDDPQLRSFEQSGAYAGQHCDLTQRTAKQVSAGPN